MLRGCLRVAAVALIGSSCAFDLRAERPGPAPSSGRFRELIRRSASEHGIDPLLFEALILAENAWLDPARVSPKGAVGLGQLMPGTARFMGVADSTDPADNLAGSARYLRYLLGRPFIAGDLILAVAAYNAGEGRVAALGAIPPFRETLTYVRRVFAYYRALGGRLGTDGKARLAALEPAAAGVDSAK